VHCERTFLKRCLHMALRSVDQHPIAVIFSTTAFMSLVLGLIVHAVLKFLG
jgi:hypothetical protein